MRMRAPRNSHFHASRTTAARIVLALPLLFLCASSVVAAQPTSASARAQEREVAAVRAVYQEVTRAVAAGHLVRRDTTVACDESDLGQEITLWRDRAGLVRQLTWAGGTDDHAQTYRSYYDAAGRLRFVFVTRGAVNGTQQELRLYFGLTGTLLRRLEKRTAGPGYPFSEPEPVRAPSEWLRQLCSQGR